MSDPGTPGGVAQTALAIAFFRDLESQREDRLFDDPYAKLFLSALGFYRNSAGISVRTKFFDDALLAAAQTCPQVVLLAAGLDARAFRLPWPEGTRLFELDLPEVLGFKELVLSKHDAKPACERTTLPIDLRSDWPEALRAGGFDPGKPTAWLAEGLLVYLTDAEVDRLVEQVGELSVPGSRLILGHQERRVIEHQQRQTFGDAERALYKSGLTVHPAEWLAPHGWKAQAERATDAAQRFGRELKVEVASSWLVDATKE